MSTDAVNGDQQAMPRGVRAVVFDVGETLVDETRQWTDQAQRAGVTPFTMMAAIGATIARGESHEVAWDLLGVARPEANSAIGPVDLYPDALACLAAVRAAGFTVGIAGNQPASAVAQLIELGFDADFVASSAEWGVAKPSPEFFARVLHASGASAHEVLYVGDRVDNDVLPAHSDGLRTAFLRRGPWGRIHAHRPDVTVADMRVDSLAELTQIITRG